MNREMEEGVSKLDYIAYIQNHVSNLRKVWKVLRSGVTTEIRTGVDNLISKHDDSKYNDPEFEPYRKNFFPVCLEDENPKTNGFQSAWNHHQKSNPHHWQYWIMWEKGEILTLPMELNYLLEMLCDWSAMALHFGDTPLDYYNKNKHNMLMHEQTFILIDKWLPLFQEAVLSFR